LWPQRSFCAWQVSLEEMFDDLNIVTEDPEGDGDASMEEDDMDL
jgi:hypothetical protein